ncbi:MAG: LDCC motif putative metal-binding protein [Candidatus Cloacimonetes bacterium]|jgi:hypothetical protein|nr:LDCC motif putative metal-binding protein [Candidatus Cloacimonadota bacterium]
MKNIKKAWAEFLKRVEKENEDLFHGNKPNCCDLNSKPKGEENEEACSRSSRNPDDNEPVLSWK